MEFWRGQGRSWGWHRLGRPGVALVLVLASVAILALMTVGFLGLARSEKVAGSAFADSLDVKVLSELPVNLVMGQIRRATEDDAPPAAGQNPTHTWASQPGLLRVFATVADPDAPGTGRARPERAHKLYSDDRLVWVAGSGQGSAALAAELAADRADLEDWDGRPGTYVDLNEPVRVVVDAAAGDFQDIYPILDPAAGGVEGGGMGVAGFSWGTDERRSDRKVPGSSANPLPMPVKWIYVLEDGSLASPESEVDGRAVFGGAGAPSDDNPIVARVAFWTDDESCKVNLNTATEGTYWDMPRANNPTDRNYAQRIPSQNEYNRYTGHPAMTSLSPIFQAFDPGFLVQDGLVGGSFEAQERLVGISPYVRWGGTRGGAQGSQVVEEKHHRLYASVDELFFDQNRMEQHGGLLAPDDFRVGKFFLTAHSRAPELTLTNKPRISLWPVSRNTAQRNAKDRLLDFCATTGDRPWRFDRAANYINHTTPGSGQHPTQDYSGRNTAMLDAYLEQMTTRPIPGFVGGTFDNKWGAARRRQIITACFDLVRWGVNTYSTGLTPQYAYLPARGGIAGTSNPGLLGETSAVPLIWREGRGFGRWPTITEAAIVFFPTAEVGGQVSEMRAYLMLEPFSPTVGPPSWTSNTIFRVNGMGGWTVAPEGAGVTISLGIPNTADNEADFATGWIGGGHSTAYTGLHPMFAGAKRSGSGDWVPKRARAAGFTAGTDPDVRKTHYLWMSDPINVAGRSRFRFSGGPITIQTYTAWPNAADRHLVQTIEMRFPACDLRVPGLGAGLMGWDDRLSVPGEYRDRLIRAGDITRSVEARSDGVTRGDLRHIAALRTVPESYFTTHPAYADPAVERLHFIRNSAFTWNGQYGPGGPHVGTAHGANRAATWNTGGTLVRGMSYFRDNWPSAPRGLDGAINADGRPGDWDTGVGQTEDGPYINIPDQGTANTGEGGYFARGSFNIETGASLGPNRQISSAIAFGSIPTGIHPSQPENPALQRPWQTLLFCPNPAARSTAADREPVALDHEGFKHPRDHLFLDNFWMPVAEPYALSEPASTAGKIQMNYEIAPFGYIERSTGLHAAMKAVKVMAISPRSSGGVSGGGGQSYKEGTQHAYELRYLINVDETLRGFRKRFEAGDVFRSATEICEIFLVPQRMDGANYNTDAKPTAGLKYEDMTDWWNGRLDAVDAFELTGDNVREGPYGQLYPRLTTKSNVFRVHYRVQTLQKVRSTGAAEWVEGQDAVVGEYRGSTLIERYLDPNDRSIVMGTGVGGGDWWYTWDRFYRFRVISRERFSP